MATGQESGRLQEYTAILDNTARLSDRRQTSNDVFIGLNSLFLTALGFFFTTTHLTTWWPTAFLGATTGFTTFFNVIWLRINNRYRNLINIRINYLAAIEKVLGQEFQPITVTYSDPGGNPISETVTGILQLESRSYLYDPISKKNKRLRTDFSRLERQMIWGFVVIYFVLAVAVAILSYLVINHFLPPFA